jgi:hypothetical protein
MNIEYNHVTQKLNSLTQFNNTTTKKVCQQKNEKKFKIFKNKKTAIYIVVS